MLNGTLIQEINQSAEEKRLYLQEWLILEVTELISDLMERKSISKKVLSSKLGKTPGYITQLLDGRTNMTLRTISDVFWALDAKISMSSGPLNFELPDNDPYEINLCGDRIVSRLESSSINYQYKLTG